MPVTEYFLAALVCEWTGLWRLAPSLTSCCRHFAQRVSCHRRWQSRWCGRSGWRGREGSCWSRRCSRRRWKTGRKQRGRKYLSNCSKKIQFQFPNNFKLNHENFACNSACFTCSLALVMVYSQLFVRFTGSDCWRWKWRKRYDRRRPVGEIKQRRWWRNGKTEQVREFSCSIKWMLSVCVYVIQSS